MGQFPIVLWKRQNQLSKLLYVTSWGNRSGMVHRLSSISGWYVSKGQIAINFAPHRGQLEELLNDPVLLDIRHLIRSVDATAREARHIR